MDHMREMLRQGFENRPTVNFGTAAKLLNLDEKTLRRLVNGGKVRYRIVGNGHARLRREFTLSDLESFYADAATRTTHASGARARKYSRVRTRLAAGGSFLATFEAETKGEVKR